MIALLSQAESLSATLANLRAIRCKAQNVLLLDLRLQLVCDYYSI